MGLVNYREKIYKNYSRNSGRILVPESISGFESRKPFYMDIINNYFPADKNTKILEIGCGSGAFQYFIKKSGYLNTIGIDTSEDQVSGAKKLGIASVIYANLIDYVDNLDDSSLDLIIAIDVIEHFSKEELSSLIDNFYRVLNKDGMIITHQPNAEGLFGNSIRYGDYTHEQSFTRSSISQIFISSRFKSVNSFEDKPIPHSFRSIVRLFLWNYYIKPITKFFLMVETGGVDKEIILTRNFLSIIKK